jgi:hypothetical protein
MIMGATRHPCHLPPTPPPSSKFPPPNTAANSPARVDAHTSCICADLCSTEPKLGSRCDQVDPLPILTGMHPVPVKVLRISQFPQADCRHEFPLPLHTHSSHNSGMQSNGFGTASCRTATHSSRLACDQPLPNQRHRLDMWTQCCSTADTD